jgi:hypothetical protein
MSNHNEIATFIGVTLEEPVVTWDAWDYDVTIAVFFDSKHFRGVYKDNEGRVMITLDHINCFNKEGQNPISVMLPLNKRKQKRLLQALEFLKTKEGQKASNTFEFETIYDEFGQHVRKEFYQGKK